LYEQLWQSQKQEEKNLMMELRWQHVDEQKKYSSDL
jgi:hypothetical protein